MRCDNCQFENSEGNKFCGGCGEGLSGVCYSCGAKTPSDYQFCGACGAPQRGIVPEDGERRHLTVMFCDVVDSTRLSETLDPEEFHKLLRVYQRHAADVVEQWQGHIAQYLGDGLLVYFGFPRANEDDAFRAVQAGLDIVNIIREFSETMEREHGVRVRVRVGIHTGTVVAGSVGYGKRVDRLAMGSTPNIAARVQGSASPNEVILTQSSYELVRDRISAEGLGPRELKGVAEPVALYRATGITKQAEELISEEIPLIGRDEEFAQLLEQHARLRQGSGVLVQVRGEAGIGKSRLIAEFKRRVAGQSQWLTCRGSAYHENVDLYPVVEMLKGRIGVSASESNEQQLAELSTWLAEIGLPESESLRAMSHALGLEHRENLSNPPTRDALLKVIREAIYCIASVQPLVIHFEDAHWADPSTSEMIAEFAEQAHGQPLFVLISSRPSFVSFWSPAAHHTTMEMQRLSKDAAESLLDTFESDNLSLSVRRQLINKADGIPLYLEQLTQAVLTLATTSNGMDIEHLIPNSLHDSLMARIDSLGDAKETTQIGALLGRSFSFEMLQAAARHPADQLEAQMNKTVQVGLLHRLGSGKKAVFRFRHALIQETAYESLLKSRRRRLHKQVADAIRERFSELVTSEPETLARHLEGAEQWSEALTAFKLAGDRANARGAFVESIRSYRKAERILKRLADDDARMDIEYDLLRAMAMPIRALGGYQNEDLRPILDRISVIAAKKGDPKSQYGLLMAEWGYHCMKGHRIETKHFSNELESFSKSVTSNSLLSGALFAVGSNHFYQGDFTTASNFLRRSIDLSHATREWGEQPRDLDHPAFLARLVLGWCTSLTGDVLQGAELIRSALTVAENHNAPFAIVQCLTWLGFCYGDINREPQETLELGERQIQIATEHDLETWLATGRAARQWALLRLGDEAARGACIRVIQGTPGEATVTTGYNLTRGAEILLDAGEIETAQTAVERAFELAEHNLGTFHLAETNRVQARIFLRKALTEDALAHFNTSLSIAEQTGAKLNAVHSLLDLCREFPDGQPQKDQLAALLESCPEIRDTPLGRSAADLYV